MINEYLNCKFGALVFDVIDLNIKAITIVLPYFPFDNFCALEAAVCYCYTAGNFTLRISFKLIISVPSSFVLMLLTP